jgi:hypothetical protein
MSSTFDGRTKVSGLCSIGNKNNSQSTNSTLGQDSKTKYSQEKYSQDQEKYPVHIKTNGKYNNGSPS